MLLPSTTSTAPGGPPAEAGGPSVSVVLITYNLERFAAPAIESVLAQTLPDWELICVDDASTDGTRDILAAYAEPDGERHDPRIRMVTHENHGISFTRDAGMCASDIRAPYILFFDGDDTLSPYALETMAFHLRRNPDAAAVVARAEHIGEDGLPCEGRFPFPEPREGLRELSEMIDRPWGMGLYPASITLYARWAAEAAGGYNVFQRACEDDDFNIRVALHGPYLFIPDVLTQYRRHGGNVTNQQEFVESTYRQVIKRRPWFRRAWNQGRGRLLHRPVTLTQLGPGESP